MQGHDESELSGLIPLHNVAVGHSIPGLSLNKAPVTQTDMRSW